MGRSNAYWTSNLYITEGEEPVPDEIIDKMARELEVGRWMMRFALYGDESVVDHRFAKIKEAFGRIEGAEVWGEKCSPDAIPQLENPHERVQGGVPNLDINQMTGWYGGEEGGHIGFSPVARLTGPDAVALRDLILVQVFLGSFIFFYPDVVAGQDLPITGGLAAVCAFAALLIKLMTKGDADVNGYRWQVILIGLGATLYIVPYFFGTQMTELTGQRVDVIMPFLVSSKNLDLALPLCYLSGVLAGVLGVIAVIYNLRQTSTPRPTSPAA